MTAVTNYHAFVICDNNLSKAPIQLSQMRLRVLNICSIILISQCIRYDYAIYTYSWVYGEPVINWHVILFL